MKTKLLATAAVFAAAWLLPTLLGISAERSCLEGLSAKAGRRALETGSLNPALIWVSKENESELRSAFDKAQAVRKLSTGAQEVADSYFLETLNCLQQLSAGWNRSSPSAPELGPAVPSAEKAVENNSPEVLNILLMDMLRQNIQKRFKDLQEKKEYDPKDIEAGRRYAQAYTDFIHYVDGISSAIQGQ